MLSLVERAGEELAALGSRPRKVVRSGLDALAPSERRVAELAAGDRSNKEIAQALCVTVKTFELHLSSAYRKLALGSRRELAAALAVAPDAAAKEYRGSVDDASERRYGRATFLLLVGGGLSSLAWGAKAGGVLSPLTSSVSQLVGNLLPVGGWRIYTISGSMPIFDAKTWRLEIGGLVANPRSFTYDELRALPRAHQVSDFHCVTGWTVHGVRWSGVRFSHLLEQVQPLPEAKAIRFVSLEQPYNDSLTLQQLRPHDVMLALEMDGEPLSRPHGSPARVVIPEMYGYKGVKWLSRIELLDHQPTGYWEGLGYDQNAWVGHSNGYSSA